MGIAGRLITEERSHYTYRCKQCGFENRKRVIPGSNVPVTKRGNYGTNTTPPHEPFTEPMYYAASISFAATREDSPAYIADSDSRFGEMHFSGGMTIQVDTESGVNDGEYIVAERGVSRGRLILETGTLTDETANDAGYTTLSRVLYKPTITSGCPNCGSLNSF